MDEHAQHRRHAAEVADAIEANEDDYDQSSIHFPCGTPACVAGWSIAVAKAGVENARGASIFTCPAPLAQAGRNLGLTPEEAEIMFDSYPYGRDGEGASPAEAVAMLRRYASTHDVRWPERA